MLHDRVGRLLYPSSRTCVSHRHTPHTATHPTAPHTSYSHTPYTATPCMSCCPSSLTLTLTLTLMSAPARCYVWCTAQSCFLTILRIPSALLTRLAPASCTLPSLAVRCAIPRCRMRAAAHCGSWVKFVHVRTLTVFFSVFFRGDTIDCRS